LSVHLVPRAAGLAAAAALCAVAAGCVGSVTPVQCAFATECAEGEACVAGSCQLLPPTCPAGLQPTFTSINTQLFQLGCGAQSNSCHSDGAVKQGISGLSLQTDPYQHLVNVAADSQPGRPQGILRVKAGDAIDSLLVIKLKLKGSSPLYGSSMPFDNPGAICDDTINVISQWIQAGAANN
jgi:hypothetical protein